MFKPNESGNPNGRKQGSQNKATKEVKEILKAILERNLDELSNNDKDLTNLERIQFTKALLPYLMPRLAAISVSNNDTNGGFQTIEVKIIRPNEDSQL
jgi:hypothetical protein